MEVTFNDNGVNILDEDTTWSKAHEMLNPLNGTACSFKTGANSISIEQLWSVGEGPHKIALVQSKKAEDNVFNDLQEKMQKMPQGDSPKLVARIENVLEASEKARLNKRNSYVKHRLVARQERRGSQRVRLGRCPR